MKTEKYFHLTIVDSNNHYLVERVWNGYVVIGYIFLDTRSVCTSIGITYTDKVMEGMNEYTIKKATEEEIVTATLNAL